MPKEYFFSYNFCAVSPEEIEDEAQLHLFGAAELNERIRGADLHEIADSLELFDEDDTDVPAPVKKMPISEVEKSRELAALLYHHNHGHDVMLMVIDGGQVPEEALKDQLPCYEGADRDEDGYEEEWVNWEKTLTPGAEINGTSGKTYVIESIQIREVTS